MSDSKYQHFKAEDFALDESFVKWAKEPNTSSSTFWGEWVKKNPHKYEEIIAALTLVRQIEFKNYEPPEEENAKVWEQIKRRITDAPASRRKPLGRSLRKSWVKITTSIAVFLVLVSAARYLTTDYSQQETVEAAPTIIVKSNPKGRKSTFKLSDGTTVKLNADSKLRFINSARLRSVELKGEAYFEVAHDPSKPFVVNASGIITRVLGTDFNVKAFPEDPEVEVALLRGKVVVSRYREGERIEELILSPSEMFTYNNLSNKLTKSTFHPAKILAWRDGMILFDEAGFDELKNELERWFGVDIVYNSRIKKEFKFTGKFRNENLKNILDNISLAMKFQYEIQNQKVIIY